MTLKFILKKVSDSSVLETGTFPSMEAGDAWVAQITGPGTYGRNQDTSYRADQLPEGLTPEMAASSEQVPRVDSHGTPVTDENGQQFIDTVYHFAKEWTVDVTDITADLAAELKVQDRSKARVFCLEVIDRIAAYNKENVDAAGMQTIFATPAFMAIILALLTGATATARAAMAAAGPSLYPAPFVSDILARMDAYLASEAE